MMMNNVKHDRKQNHARLQSLQSLEKGFAMFKASTSESLLHMENQIMSSVVPLQNSIRDEIYSAIQSHPTEQSLNHASLETLADMITDRIAPRYRYFTTPDRMHESRPPLITSSIARASLLTQHECGTVDPIADDRTGSVRSSLEEGQDPVVDQGNPVNITSQSSSKRITTWFGTAVIRRCRLRIPIPNRGPGLVLEKVQTQFSFVPTDWLRSWTSCGVILAQTGLGQRRLQLARIVDAYSEPHRQMWSAVDEGDLSVMRQLLHRKVAFPTDRNSFGASLLSVSQFQMSLARCKLVLLGPTIGPCVMITLSSVLHSVQPYLEEPTPVGCFWNKVQELTSTHLTLIIVGEQSHL